MKIYSCIFTCIEHLILHKTQKFKNLKIHNFLLTCMYIHLYISETILIPSLIIIFYTNEILWTYITCSFPHLLSLFLPLPSICMFSFPCKYGVYMHIYVHGCACLYLHGCNVYIYICIYINCIFTWKSSYKLIHANSHQRHSLKCYSHNI